MNSWEDVGVKWEWKACKIRKYWKVMGSGGIYDDVDEWLVIAPEFN